MDVERDAGPRPGALVAGRGEHGALVLVLSAGVARPKRGEVFGGEPVLVELLGEGYIFNFTVNSELVNTVAS